jgi:hypothetical protein
VTRYIRNMCKIEFEGGSPYDVDVIVPGHAASNGDTWVISRMQMREVDGRRVPTGRTERVDQLTECTIVGDEDDPVLVVTGQSTYLAEAGVPEDDRQVKVRVIQNPKHRR